MDNDEDDDQDWMTTLLQTAAFHRIPPANIQAIFIRMQQINFKAGDVVIKQGDEGDFFYAITRGAMRRGAGNARSTRKASSSPNSASAIPSAKRR